MYDNINSDVTPRVGLRVLLLYLAFPAIRPSCPAHFDHLNFTLSAEVNMDRPPVGDVDDLATLAKLDEQILLGELRERYRRGRIYVS